MQIKYSCRSNQPETSEVGSVRMAQKTQGRDLLFFGKFSDNCQFQQYQDYSIKIFFVHSVEPIREAKYQKMAFS